MDLHFTPYFTFQGDLIFGDTDHENIPLVRMSFHGPCASLTVEGKMELIRRLGEHLADLAVDTVPSRAVTTWQ